MPTQTDVSICNLALGRLGQDPITAFTDGTEISDRCRDNWPIVHDNVLRSYEWPCLVKRVALVAHAGTPLFGFDKWFDLPADYLRLLELDDTDVEYQIEGNLLLANATAVNIRYICRPSDFSTYEPGLIEALIKAMIKTLAYSVTASTTFSQAADADFDKAAQAAKAPSKTEKDSIDDESKYDWLTSRM